LVFLIPGLAMMTGALRSLFSRSPVAPPAPAWTGAVVAVVLTCFAVVSGGVAVFGDPRGFRGGVTIFGVALFGRPGSKLAVVEARFVFGLVAILLGALALLFWVLTIGAFLARRKARTIPVEGDPGVAGPSSPRARGSRPNGRERR
jgi:hypothetical protein